MISWIDAFFILYLGMEDIDKAIQRYQQAVIEDPIIEELQKCKELILNYTTIKYFVDGKEQTIEQQVDEGVKKTLQEINERIQERILELERFYLKDNM